MSSTPTPRPATGAATRHLEQVRRYYSTVESRLLYRVLGGTKHYGLYRPGDPFWEIYPAMRRMEDLLAQKLALPAGSRVLDAGCGVGDVASRLAAVHGLRVTGIDIQGNDVEEAERRAARQRLSDELTFFEMDYAQLAFPPGSFDGAYTMETLVHSDRVEDVLAGLHRALRPGGRLVHFEYSRSPKSETSEHDERFLSEVNQVAALPAFQRFEHGLLEGLLTEAGFVDVQAEDVTDKMLPMLKAFAIGGWLPYLLGSAVGRSDLVVNSRAGVEFYLHRNCWRYNIYTCRKPA